MSSGLCIRHILLLPSSTKWFPNCSPSEGVRISVALLAVPLCQRFLWKSIRNVTGADDWRRAVVAGSGGFALCFQWFGETLLLAGAG